MLCLSKAAMDRTEATPGILAEILNAEYDVLFNIGCLLPFNDDPLRKKKQGETRQMGCVQDFKLKERSHATSSCMESAKDSPWTMQKPKERGRQKLWS